MKKEEITTEQAIDAKLSEVKLRKRFNPIGYDRINYYIDLSILISLLIIFVTNVVVGSLHSDTPSIIEDAVGIAITILAYYCFGMIIGTTVRRVARYHKATRR
jgi:hypothetical protein